MLTKIKSRIKSNRGDGNSVSHILWIAVATAVVSVTGLAIFNATKYSGLKSGARLQNLGCYLKRGGEACTMEQKDVNWINYDLRYEKLGKYKVYTDDHEDYMKAHPEFKDDNDGYEYVKKPN